MRNIIMTLGYRNKSKLPKKSPVADWSAWFPNGQQPWFDVSDITHWLPVNDTTRFLTSMCPDTLHLGSM